MPPGVLMTRMGMSEEYVRVLASSMTKERAPIALGHTPFWKTRALIMSAPLTGMGLI